MKIFVALLLVAVMCLSFVACGGSDNADASSSGGIIENNGNTNIDTNKLNLCQEWKAISTGEEISFDENCNFCIDGQTYPYEYDEESNKILVDVGIQVSLAVSLIDGIYRIDVEGTEYVPATEYEKLHAEYVKTMMVIPSWDGTPAINRALIKYYIDRVELTIDNWKEYIKEYSYDIEIVEKDAFGEITEKETVTVYRLGYGTEKYHCLSATIELKHKQTGEIILLGEILPVNAAIDIGAVSTKPFHLEEYECTRIKGYMYFINYPEEVIDKVLHVYDRWIGNWNAFIAITSDFAEGRWNVDCDAKVIESESDDWSDYFE